jgi:chlorophyllide a reductase subunit Y
VAAVHPFYRACAREFEAAGRSILGSAPVGYEATAQWLEAIAAHCGAPANALAAAKQASLPMIRQTLDHHRIRGRITLSGYEGSELLVGRLLLEAGADLRYVGTALARTPYSAQDAEWLSAQGVEVRFRASLEQDLEAMEQYTPDLAIGTTPLVQKAKERALPALYFTNLISARPLMGVAGAASLAHTVNTAISGRERFDRMHRFFAGVGTGDCAGVWHDKPEARPAFREQFRRMVQKKAEQRKAVEVH